MTISTWAGVAAATALVFGMPAAAGAHAGPAARSASTARTLGPVLHPFVRTARGRGRVAGSLHSANWSGFIDGVKLSSSGLQSVGAHFSSVSASFTVPQLSASSPTNSSNAVWTGIGGVLGTGGIVQAGVLESFKNQKNQTYTPIVEDYPNPIVPLSEPVSPGDTLTVTITDTSGSWTLTMSDSTKNWSIGPTDISSWYAAGAFVAPDTQSAEWIDEDPFCGGTYCKFATFSPANFSAVTDTATSANSRTPLETIIVNRFGQAEVSVAPSSIGSTATVGGAYDSFTVTRVSSSRHGPHA